MTFKTVRLDSIGEIITGSTPSKEVKDYYGDYMPFISPMELGEINSGVKFVDTSKTYLSLEGSMVARIIPKNAILTCCIGSLGKIGIANIAVVTNQQINSLVVDKTIADYRYVYYAVARLKNKMEQIAPSTTVKIINKSKFSELEISLPSFDIQKQIAASLDAADALIQKRKEAIVKLDGLIESIFLEMFGDPISNPYGLNTIKFGEILEKIESGWSPKCDDKPAEEGEWGVLKLSSVTKGVYAPRENKKLLPGTESDSTIEVNEGDLLFTRKNTKDLVGACAYVFETPEHLMMPDTIFRFRFNSFADIEKLYIWGLFNNRRYKKLVIQQLAEGSAGSMPNISKKKLESMVLLYPSTELQQKYSQHVIEIQLQKNNMLNQLEKLEENFQSLLHQAFTGRLQFRDSKVDEYALKR